MTESPFVTGLIADAVRAVRVTEGRTYLLDLLETQFRDELTRELREWIVRQDDPELLRDWIGAASRVASFADFLTVLRLHSSAWEQSPDGLYRTESKQVNRWIEKACRAAQLAAAREFLLVAIRQRFDLPLPPEVVAAIQAQASVPLLKSWFREALAAASLSELLAVLQG